MKDFRNFDPKAYIQRMDTPEKYEEVYRVFADFACANVAVPMTVLDVACGPGVLACALAERWKDARITGVDISEEMVNYARRRAERAGYRNLEFILGDAMMLPFQDENFDVVVCRGFLKVVPNIKKFLGECWRVLKSDGKMFVSDTYFEGISVLPEICRNADEYPVLEEAVKHSLKLSEIQSLFSGFPSSIFLRGISVYIVGRKAHE
ncbi:MAG: methyltransferase domain-containing protein [Thermoplasmata archaeon]|nr:methyltransferase domain-containing protein [Thermoplasmata archaeon]